MFKRLQLIRSYARTLYFLLQETLASVAQLDQEVVGLTPAGSGNMLS